MENASNLNIGDSKIKMIVFSNITMGRGTGKENA
jgi:hypothetical protein